jgi:hypothetical protein
MSGWGNMNRLIEKTVTIVLLTFIVGAIGYVTWQAFTSEELRSKPEWSVVQMVEWKHRGETNNAIEFVTVDKYSLVGITAHDPKEKIWIMLNAKNPPYYKQIPAGNYTLSKEEFKTIIASNIISSTVANCLESHVEEP